MISNNPITLRSIHTDNLEQDLSEILSQIDHSIFGIEIGVSKFGVDKFILSPPHLFKNKNQSIVDTGGDQFQDFASFEGYLSSPYFLPLRKDLRGNFEKQINQFIDILNENEEIVFVWLFKKKYNWREKALTQYESYLKGNDRPSGINLVRNIQEKVMKGFSKLSNIDTIREFSEDVEDKLIDSGFVFQLKVLIKSEEYEGFKNIINELLGMYDCHNSLRLEKVNDLEVYRFANRGQLLSKAEIQSLFGGETVEHQLPEPKKEEAVTTNHLVNLLPYVEKKANKLDETLVDNLAEAMKKVDLISQARLYNAEIQSGSRLTIVTANIPKGLKLSKITKEVENIQAEMGIQSLGIEQGSKAGTVKFSIPNDNQVMVSLREMMEKESFQKFSKDNPLAFIAGVDELDHPIYLSLSKLVNLLIAGTVGSGKSVFLNQLITTFLINYTPEELELYLVDPKKLELNIFEGFPHVKKVVTDMKKATVMFKSLVNEMERRYEVFSEAKVKNIQDYNQKNRKKLPYIVFAVDEVADLMMVSEKEVEDHLQRLGQMARAAGIHIILATQRPSADVIKGTIKNNFQNAISFNLGSNRNYKTVFDKGIPFSLLGNGDGVARIEGAQKEFQRFQSPIIHPNSVEVEGTFEKLIKAMTTGEINMEKEEVVVEESETMEVKEEEEYSLIYQLKQLIATTKETRVGVLREKLGVKSETLSIAMSQLVEEGWLIKHRSKAKGYELVANENILNEWRVH